MRLLCPAKINLWLQVVRKRPDGYHDLWSLMLPVDLHDEMEIDWEKRPGVEISVEGFSVPSDRGNIVWKAYERYRHFAKWPDHGVKVRLRKNIPVGAGLGGGSSNAAAMLKFLNLSNPSPCSQDELIKIAASVGADVPFFIKAMPAVASGIGDRLMVVEGVPGYTLLLIKPPFEISTSKVYESLRLTEKKALISIKMFLQSPWSLDRFLQNDLEVVAANLYPVIKEVKSWLRKEGALGVGMSGSGSAVFGIFSSTEEALIAQEKGGKFWGNSWWMRVCRVLSQVENNLATCY